MGAFALALRMLRRDWRAGELRVLVAALVLAVASVGTVGFFTDRVKGALARQANLLLGAACCQAGVTNEAVRPRVLRPSRETGCPVRPLPA